MIEKNLTELLQEEAQKFTPVEGEPLIEVTAKTIETTTYTKTNLETTVKELQEIIGKLQQKELDLQQQITDLKIALSEKQVFSEKLTTELYEAKQTALQLADSNSKLIEESKALVPIKQPIKEQYREIPKSINPKKSHRSPERLQEDSRQANDDFASNTWLYD